MKVVLAMFKGGKRRDFPLNATHTVLGRKADCTLRIPTPDVSRRHCEITVLDDGVAVRDLGSANGTYVNGKRIAEKDLAPGDELAVGPVKFYVQIDGKPEDLQPRKAAAAEGGEEQLEGSSVVDFDVDEIFLSDADMIEEDEEDVISALETLSDEDDETKPPQDKSK